MGLHSGERQQRVFELVSAHGEQATEALGQQLGVSPATMRRDLAALERRGLIQRTWGGARVAVPVVYTDGDFQGETVKRSIAATAARLVEPGMVIAVSGGSTCTELARWLRGRRIKVVTNALNVALELRASSHTRVVLSGGELNVASYELIGDMVARSLSEYRVDMAFVGCSGVMLDFGFSMRDEPEANAARAITRVADRVVVIADHRKVGRRTSVRFARFDEVERLITDDGLTPAWRAQLAQAGLQIDLAPGLPNDLPPTREQTWRP